MSQLLSDYSDFGRPQILRDALHSPPGDSRLHCSPDGRHLFVWLPRQRRLLSFLRLPPDSHPQPGAYLEQSWPARAPALCGLLFLQCPGPGWLLTLVWRSGRADVWSPPRAASSKPWELLQSLELCTGPRAGVASVCCCGEELVWCEERPPSRPQDPSSPFTYCICRRSLRVGEGQRVTLGSMRIVLHHSPRYTLLCPRTHVFMVPDRAGPQPLLVYSSAEDAILMATVPVGPIHSQSLAGAETDYKKMILEHAGFLARQPPLGIRHVEPTGAGHLLLMTSAMRIYLLYDNGSVRHVFDLEATTNDDEAEVKMQLFGATLACARGTALYLIDVRTGRLMAKQLMNAEEMFFLKVMDTEDVQVLTKSGIYTVGRGGEAGGRPEPAGLDMVYEEACKYYQKRSLSSAKLTVQTLKREGMFQAPIILSAILRGYQQNGQSKESMRYAELLGNMDNELQSFLSLELLKACIINASVVDIERYAEELVDHEITRLLQMNLDRDTMVYINSLFSTFPRSAWTSLRNNFQFQQNSDGALVVRATADLWNKVLSPVPPGSGNCSPNGIYPLFEVICQSLCTFKPKWLPAFVQHAQDCSGLCWTFAAKETSEGAPLYKRALSVLQRSTENTKVDLEVDILLNSGRPQAVLQAIHVLIGLQRWSRVMAETKRFSQLSPLITKDIFITLLVEFVNHRHLDPYVAQLCDICPEGMTATDLLRVVLQNLPKGQADAPFARDGGAHLTVGLLKPLLNKVLHRQLGKDENSRLQTFPPVTPQRTSRSGSQTPLVNGDNQSPTDIYATNSSDTTPFSTGLK